MSLQTMRPPTGDRRPHTIHVARENNVSRIPRFSRVEAATFAAPPLDLPIFSPDENIRVDPGGGGFPYP
jgi:hypothetical protein